MFKQKLIDIVTGKPKLTILIIVAITLLLGSGARKLVFDDNLINMLPKDLPSRMTMDKFEDTFGGTDFIMIGIGVKNGTIFNTDTLKKVEELTEKVRNIQGIDKVDSLSTLNQIKGREWGLEVKPFMETVPTTEEGLKQLERDIFEDDSFVGTYVSLDKRYTTIIGTTLTDADELAIFHTLEDMRKEMYGPGVDEVFLTGMPILRSTTGESLKGDLQKFLPFILLVLVVVLYLSIRTVSGVLCTLAVITFSVIPTMGLMGHLGRPIMIINNTTPVILLAIACADSIHIITHFYKHLKDTNDKTEAVKHTLSELTLPVVVTSITTMAGFISLITTPVPTIGEFGVFIAFGVFWALLLSLTFLPALLMTVPTPRHFHEKKHKKDLVEMFLHGLAGLVSKHRFMITTAAICVVIFSLMGMTKINVETNPSSWLDADSEYRVAARAADDHFGGAINMSLMVESDIINPEILNDMSDFQSYLATLPEIGKSYSIADVVKRLNKAINGNEEQYKVIPDTREQVAQALLLYSFSGDPSDFERMIDNDYKTAAINIRLGTLKTRLTTRLVDNITKKYKEIFPKDARIDATGTAVFISDLDPLIINSTILSLIVAMIVVILINGLAYRSVVIGLVSVIPLGLAVILNFGIMGWFGIDLSIPLAIISSIAIGVGVDYAVHYAASYRDISQTVQDPDEKIKAIFQRVGKPILYNAVSVASGFTVLMISNFEPVRYLGFLIAFSMVSCSIGALTILASVLYILNPKLKEAKQ